MSQYRVGTCAVTNGSATVTLTSASTGADTVKADPTGTRVRMYVAAMGAQ